MEREWPRRQQPGFVSFVKFVVRIHSTQVNAYSLRSRRWPLMGEETSTRMKRNGTRMEANPLLRIRFIRVIRGSKSFRRGDVLMGKEFQRE
jgi:hypothetical protein